MPIVIREKDRQGTGLEIKLSGSTTLSIQISPEGVTILPLEKPFPLKPKEERPVDQKFRLAFVEAAAALINANLPYPTDIYTMPTEVNDKLDKLNEVTQSLLAAHGWGGKKRLRILVGTTQKDLSPFLQSKTISNIEWEQCQSLLAEQIKGSVDYFKQRQFKKRAEKPRA